MRNLYALLTLLLIAGITSAQSSSPSTPVQTALTSIPASAASESPVVSRQDPDSLFNRGFSSYTSITQTHDSFSGWSSVLNSSVRYDFSKKFGMELGVPFYIVHNGTSSSAVAAANSNLPLKTSYNSLGDVALTLSFNLPDSWLGYSSTLTGTGPSGDTSSGISTGRAQVDFNNHFEHEIGYVTPLLEFGVGTSSALVNKNVKRPYTTLGALSHYKLGADLALPFGFRFEGAGYEDLPIGDQKVYSHVLRPSTHGPIAIMDNHKRRTFQMVSVASGQGIFEDNGFSAVLSRQLYQHMDMSVSYDRSLRQGLDTVSMTLGYRIGRTKKKEIPQ